MNTAARAADTLKCSPDLDEHLSPQTRAEVERCGFAGSYGMGHLIMYTRSELAQKLGLSLSAINELEEFLATRGLRLGAKLENWPPAELQGRSVTSGR